MNSFLHGAVFTDLKNLDSLLEERERHLGDRRCWGVFGVIVGERVVFGMPYLVAVETCKTHRDMGRDAVVIDGERKVHYPPEKVQP